MKRTVTALDARRRLGELLETVYHRGDEVVIERAGKPMAVVISAAKYEAIESRSERLIDIIREIHEFNANVPEDELLADIEAALSEVRGKPVSLDL